MNSLGHLSRLLISILAVASLPVHAESGFYMGASVGSANLSDDFDGLSIDTDATAYRITAGWRFSEYFGIEAGYHDFGDFEQEIEGSDISLSADGYTFGVSGAWPLVDKLALTGRLGWFFWDGAAEINNVSQASPEDTNLYFGAGLQYSLTGHFALTADWSQYDLEDARSDVISAGFLYRFGQ